MSPLVTPRSAFMVALFLCGTMKAQHEPVKDTALARSLDAYLVATRHKDFPYIVDHVHPALLAIMPKADMIDAMEKAFNDPEVPMSLDSVLIERVKGPMIQNAITYHLIRYEIHMRMHVASDTADDGALLDATEQTSKDELLLSMLQLAYGKDHVDLVPGARDYLITDENVMFAVLDPALDGRKFVGYKLEMMSLMDTMVPAKVRKKLGVK